MSACKHLKGYTDTGKCVECGYDPCAIPEPAGPQSNPEGAKKVKEYKASFVIERGEGINEHTLVADETGLDVVCDWVEIQIAMIRLNQADVLEVFLPYVWLPRINNTFYGQLKDKEFKQLTSREKEN